MYFDKARGRVLLRDGTSVVSSLGFAERILAGKSVEGLRVAEDRHSRIYDAINNTNTSIELDDVHPTPDNQHTDEEIETLVNLILESDRYEPDNEDHLERIALELDFFIRTYNIKFILRVHDVIKRFEDENVLWGVGRGSSCASLVAYVLHINDINPLIFNIPFKELSKEED